MNGFDEIKQRQRHMWTVGDFPQIAERTVPAAAGIVERLGIGAGDRVLDVATGTGNGALIAAQRGAVVNGLDLTPKLLGVSAERAAAAGVEGPSVETWLDDEEKMLGPLILAKEALEPGGRWPEVRAQLAEQTAAANQATDGSLVLEPEYLRSVIELPD